MAKILSIDGGGIKGIFAASLLAEVESKCNVRICDYFDMIAGTSTGGIIASALAIGIPARQILDLYMNKARIIFPEKRGIWRRIMGSKYNTEPLQLELTGIFGDLKIKDCLTRLVMPTYNLENQSVHVFKTPHAEDLLFDKELKIVDCLLATTAAPTYLRPHQMHGGVFIDGGIGANNPSLIAVIEGITRCEWKREDIKVLSIGGINEADGATNGMERMGAVDAAKILKCFMNAESQYAENISRLLITKDNLVRINYNSFSNQVSIDKTSKNSLILLKDWGMNQAQDNIWKIKNMFLQETKSEFNLYNC
ncbi:MAG TPA: patatin-like phospholipase family protein [Clostridiales bacterium]|nr:patatin-like phospholipase family protein [Clostridiales bacterium]